MPQQSSNLRYESIVQYALDHAVLQRHKQAINYCRDTNLRERVSLVLLYAGAKVFESGFGLWPYISKSRTSFAGRRIIAFPVARIPMPGVRFSIQCCYLVMRGMPMAMNTNAEGEITLSNEAKRINRHLRYPCVSPRMAWQLSAYARFQSAISNWRPTADLGRKYICRLFLLFVSLYPFAANAQHTIFPLRISENHRYLEDATGRPFLITGDSAWSLIGDLSREDADKYLADRQHRGFNTLIVGLIEHRFSRNAPRNFYKRAPFEENAAFSQPNDAYFDDADWILQQARDRGFLVLLTPAYMGVNGGAEGWYQEMQAAGPDVLKSYGRYLGKRYQKYNNIIWVQGGDFDPPDRTLANALAEGIAETDPGAFQTIHARLDTDVALNWKATSWLTLDTIYTYGDVAAKSLLRYITGPVTPFFLIESIYEGEHNASEQNIRANAYGAILSGACGQIFGNNPIWHFGGPGVFEQPKTWQESLASRGAQSMTYLKAFFDKIAWWTLEPEQGKLLVAPNPLLPGEAIGSLSVDGTLAVIYLSDRRSVALNMASLSPSAQQAHWFDPSSGKFSEAVPKNTDKAGITEFQVPQERNSAGFSDWLLMVTNRN
eukprot:gene12496-15273_t